MVKKKRVVRGGGEWVGKIVFSCLERMGGRREKSRLNDLWQRRDDVFGKDVGGQLLEISDKKNVLVLKVADSAVMQELLFQKNEIIRQANNFLGSEYFTDLRVSI